MRRNIAFVAMGLCLVLSSAILMGSALREPAREVRSWEITTSVTSAETEFTFTGAGGATNQIRTSRSVLLIHDTAGGDDIYCSFEDTASAPTAGGASFRLRAGETVNIDGQFTRASFAAAANTPAVRMIVSF